MATKGLKSGMAKVSDSREGSSYKDSIFFGLKSKGVSLLGRNFDISFI